VPIDTNCTERGFRGPALGRTNFYGSHSNQGTEVAAIFYSLIETAKLNGVEPKRYLKVALTAALAGDRIPLSFELVDSGAVTDRAAAARAFAGRLNPRVIEDEQFDDACALASERNLTPAGHSEHSPSTSPPNAQRAREGEAQLSSSFTMKLLHPKWPVSPSGLSMASKPLRR
jgi:hypothetical protein